MTQLRTGITTGTCAAAAAHAAACVLAGGDAPSQVELTLPGGQLQRVDIFYAKQCDCGAIAAVRKDAGDDPDVTDGAEVIARLSWSDEPGVTFIAGAGVGTVTRPGLQIQPGEPAINPVPRRMIAEAVRQVTARAVRVEISITGGGELAAKTFNPRLGVVGGLSILGTTGIVRPYCRRAIRDAIRCAFSVAAASGIRRPVVVPGNIGAAAAAEHYGLAEQQIIEASNEWDLAADLLGENDFASALIVGHPGKLAKIAFGHWNTHSGESPSACSEVAELAAQLLGKTPADTDTVEGVFQGLTVEDRATLAEKIAQRIADAITQRAGINYPLAVELVNMAGETLGGCGDRQPWETPSQILIVGCGPGSADYVSDEARQAAGQVDVLLGSKRLLELFPDAPGERVELPAGVADAMECIDEHTADRTAAVLVSGDPNVFSLADAITKRFDQRCRVIAGVSSVQVAFERLGETWADARIVSAHGRVPEDSPESLATEAKFAVLAGTQMAMEWAADLAERLSASHQVHVCENLTLPEERVYQAAAEQLRTINAPSLTVLIFLRRQES